MQENPYLFIFQGTKKDHKRNQIPLRHQLEELKKIYKEAV